MRPCKWLDANTFTEKGAGEYFKEKFYEHRNRYGKGEGVELSKTFEVTAYPTMFVFDDKGIFITKLRGVMDRTILLGRVENKQAIIIGLLTHNYKCIELYHFGEAPLF